MGAQVFNPQLLGKGVSGQLRLYGTWGDLG